MSPATAERHHVSTLPPTLSASDRQRLKRAAELAAELPGLKQAIVASRHVVAAADHKDYQDVLRVWRLMHEADAPRDRYDLIWAELDAQYATPAGPSPTAKAKDLLGIKAGPMNDVSHELKDLAEDCSSFFAAACRARRYQPDRRPHTPIQWWEVTELLEWARYQRVWQREAQAPGRTTALADQLAELRTAAESQFKGKTLATLQALCNATAPVLIGDLPVLANIKSNDPFETFKRLDRDTKKWLRGQGWVIRRHNNRVRLDRLPERPSPTPDGQVSDDPQPRAFTRHPSRRLPPRPH